MVHEQSNKVIFEPEVKPVRRDLLKPDQRANNPVSIDLVNVVFRVELPLLLLQARSIARYFDAESLNEIIVILNDPDEARCHREVEAMRTEYGHFADRLRIVSPSALLDTPDSVYTRLRASWVAGGRTRFKALFGRSPSRGNPKGWCGNNGWSMQQAFKLLSARVCTGTHIVFLDAKNHFLKPVDATRFVARDGRARSRKLRPDVKQREWIEASFAAIGLPMPLADEAPPTVTPFSIERCLLADCIQKLTEQLGPLECFFALRRGKATEFMLIYAALDRGEGHWKRLFADALPTSTTVFRPPESGDPDDTTLLETVKALRVQPTLLSGIHRTRLQKLKCEARYELSELWIDHGLISDPDEFDRLFPELP